MNEPICPRCNLKREDVRLIACIGTLGAYGGRLPADAFCRELTVTTEPFWQDERDQRGIVQAQSLIDVPAYEP